MEKEGNIEVEAHLFIKHRSWLPSDHRIVLGIKRWRKGSMPQIKGSSMLNR